MSMSKYVSLQHTQLVTTVAFEKTGSKLLTGSADGSLRIWDTKILSVVCSLPGTKRIASAKYCPLESRLIAAGDWGFTTKVWDCSVGKNLISFNGHTGKISSLSFRWCGKILLTGSEDKSIRLWDFRTGKSTAPMTSADEVLDCSISPDGKTLVAACKNNVLLLWDVRDRSRPYAELTGHGDWVTCCAWSPDGLTILSGSTDKTMRLWNPTTGAVVRTFPAAAEAVTCCVYAGADAIVSGGGNRFWESKDNPVTLWSPDEEASHTLGRHEDAVLALAISYDGARLATCSMDRTARVWALSRTPPEERARDKDASRASTARASTARAAVTRQDSVRRPKAWAFLSPKGECECPLGCGRAVSRAAAAEHEARECPLRRVTCPLCGEESAAQDAAAHAERDCPERQVACACGAAIRPADAAAHAAACPLERRPCPLGCGLEVAAADEAAHVGTRCQEREVACVLGCGERVRARWILRHQQRDCAARDVRCDMCGEAFPARDADAHAKRHCPGQPVVCRLGCARRLAARDLLAHEERDCPRRAVPCPLGCGESPPAADAEEHRAGPCPMRRIPCERGCGESVPQAAYAAHVRACDPRRSPEPAEPLPPSPPPAELRNSPRPGSPMGEFRLPPLPAAAAAAGEPRRAPGADLSPLRAAPRSPLTPVARPAGPARPKASRMTFAIH